MSRKHQSRIAVAGTLTFATLSVAAQQFVHPAKGQSPDQQKKDEGACLEGKGYTVK